MGASGGLYTSLQALCEEGDNILMPRPGFPLCIPICQNLNVEVRYYDLDPENDFQVDFSSAQSQVDERTKAFILINPSNPCGSVYSEEHLKEVAEFCKKNQLVVIADEIYHGLAYDEESIFYPFAEIDEDLPVLTIGGISKIYGVPGWRLGWVICHN